MQIKLVTDCGKGSLYVEPERLEVEDDGSVTIVVRAWRDAYPDIIEDRMTDTLS